MTKTKKSTYIKAKKRRVHKWVWIAVVLLLAFCLFGCAKTAPEVATDAALHQANAVEQQIKKECPTAKIDEQMDALRATIKSQLTTCETTIQIYRERNNTLWLALFAIFVLWVIKNRAKIKARFIK